ncbi:MAG: flagellar biosynthetic protein FliR [Planctomycetota bacterium]
MEQLALMTWTPSLFLHFVRIGTFFAAQPLFGNRGDSKLPRIILAVSIGSMMFWIHGAPIVPTHGLTHFGMLAVREALIGLALGLVARLMTTALVIGGEILSHEMGFAMARVADPITGRSTPVISTFLEIIAFVMVFQLDLHHDLLRAFIAVYELVPVGEGFSIDNMQTNLTRIVGDVIVYAVRYVLPVMGVMTLLTAGLVVMARAVQHINLMEFSFGLRILLALLSSLYFLVEGAPFLEHVFRVLMTDLALLFAGS